MTLLPLNAVEYIATIDSVSAEGFDAQPHVNAEAKIADAVRQLTLTP